MKQCNVGKTITNDPFGNGFYHLFMVIWGMVDSCFTHILHYFPNHKPSFMGETSHVGFDTWRLPTGHGYAQAWQAYIDALQEKVHLGLNQLCGFLAAKLGGSNPWGYPNSWMVYKGKSIYNWMI